MSDFNKLTGDFSSFHWWVSVVVVGVLINLSSGVFQTLLGRFWEKFKAKSAEKSKRKQSTFDRRVLIYCANPVLMVMDSTLVVGFMLFGLACLVLVLLGFIGGAIFFLQPGSELFGQQKNSLNHFGPWLLLPISLLGLSVAFLQMSLEILKPITAARRKLASAITSQSLTQKSNP